MSQERDRKRIGIMGGLLTLAAMGAVFALVIGIANWLPGVLQKGLMAEYASVEEVRRTLRIRNVYVPSYIPENVSWPPSQILAQTKPFEAVVLEFGSTGRVRGPLLVISQSTSLSFAPFERLSMQAASERTAYEFKGRRAVLTAGTCGGGASCSMIEWDEADRHIRMLMAGPPFALIRMAESMVSAK